MRMDRDQWDELVAHAQEDAPNECCGYLRIDDGRVGEVFRSTNGRASPYGYELDAESLLAANNLDWDGHGVGIYHSHPKSPAEPSQTDINLAENWPEPLYLICSLANEDAPEVRAWAIRDAKVEEVGLDVD
jgi:[CysO sulfur-carrier protein]-S-L-cysteine hydrolase